MVKKSSAFTLIEIIFAILIISLTVAALPMIVQSTSTSMEKNLVQEAIFATSAKLNQASTYYWDENSLEDINNSSFSKVINSDTNDCNATTKLRIGHINQPKHRRCLDSNSTRATDESNFGLDANENTLLDADDIDDLHSDTYTALFIDPSGDTTSAQGYKQTYTINTSVSYAGFGTTLQSDKNIKKIKITVKDSSGKVITSLSSYSANIGEVDYAMRSYQ